MFKKLDNPTKFSILLVLYMVNFSVFLALCISCLGLDKNIGAVIAILTTAIIVPLMLKHYVQIPK